MLTLALLITGASTALVLITAGLLHLLGVLGPTGRGIQDALARAPLMDLVVAWLTMGPPVGAIVFARFVTFTPPDADPSPARWVITLVALGSAILGQLVALYVWCALHELANRKHLAPGQPRLVRSIERTLGHGRRTLAGRVRYHTALLWMLWAVPVLNVIRLAQYIVYPVLVRVARLPPYTDHEWVNVSRFKVQGLVGHDLIWCLYCDWMTGVWSLGSEMLRNIESFWCPIRFASDEKCKNCAHDFPDVMTHWSGAHEGVQAAAAVIDRGYPGPNNDNSWLGHESRATLTVGGKSAHAHRQP